MDIKKTIKNSAVVVVISIAALVAIFSFIFSLWNSWFVYNTANNCINRGQKAIVESNYGWGKVDCVK